MKKIKHYMKFIHNFIFHNPDRMQTLQILWYTTWYQLLIFIVPMKKLEKSFGRRGVESPTEECLEQVQIAYLIGKRVERITKHTPWTSKCLVRALVAQTIAHKKNILTTLYLGVKEENGSLLAHAWLRCGKYIITGGDGFDDFDATIGILDENKNEYSIVAFFEK